MTVNVLLMEDDPAKKQKLLRFLQERKEIFGRVKTVLCTDDAESEMRDNLYDLFIADIVVPQVIGGDKSESNSIALLEKLDDGFGGIIRPRFILPVSSSGELGLEVRDFFRGRPWGIVEYSEDGGDCMSTVEEIARYVLRQSDISTTESPGIQPCDVFIVTALVDPEFSSLERQSITWGAMEPLDDAHLIRRGVLSTNQGELSVAIAYCSRMGPVAASILVTKGMLLLSPGLVIMSGICAGIPKKAGVGDVVAADISWDWQSGKYVDESGEEGFEIAPHQISIADDVRNGLISLGKDAVFWSGFSDVSRAMKVPCPKLVMGPMASGASVLADERVSSRIRKTQHKNVVGLDMETYAVFAAVQSANTSTRFVSLKAVSDNGDIMKDDKYRQYASDVAAAATVEFIKKFRS